MEPLWIGMKADLSQSLGQCPLCQTLLHMSCNISFSLSPSSFMSSAVIPSIPGDLFSFRCLIVSVISDRRMFFSSCWFSFTSSLDVSVSSLYSSSQYYLYRLSTAWSSHITFPSLSSMIIVFGLNFRVNSCTFLYGSLVSLVWWCSSISLDIAFT